VLGLARGALAAGAHAAVVSLWPVDDFSTCLFMGKFYERWQSHRNPALALREAQDFLRNCTDRQIQAERQRLAEKFGEPETRACLAGATASSSNYSRHFYERL
jgi:CHAT domain-containing protein